MPTGMKIASRTTMAMTTLHHNIVVLDWLDFLQNVAIEPTSDLVLCINSI